MNIDVWFMRFGIVRVNPLVKIHVCSSTAIMLLVAVSEKYKDILACLLTLSDDIYVWFMKFDVVRVKSLITKGINEATCIHTIFQMQYLT